jgi:AraC-like DNA-binding protein
MSEIFHRLPLGEPPRLVQIGIGQHGDVPYERFFIPNLWCLHFFRDPLDLKVDGHSFAVQRGCVTFIPPSVSIEYFFSRPTRHIHLFALLEVENDAKIAPVAGSQQLHGEFEHWYGQMEEILAWHQTQPERARARLWEILWFLAKNGERPEGSDPLVERARELIERRLHEPISVAALARDLDVSHNHLTRRFRQATGKTVVETIRQRRVARAEGLLRHTTLPIKAIAAQSGLGDFHAFNKALRRVSGQGPRAVRRSGTVDTRNL